VPLVSISKVNLSVEWKQLWHGRLVGEIDLFHPKPSFVS
jgi:hypothetical protein